MIKYLRKDYGEALLTVLLSLGLPILTIAAVAM